MYEHTSRKKEVRITCIQMHSLTNQKEKNLEKMERLADQALSDYPDTDLILFPELALTGCECDAETTKTIAEPLHGPSVQRLAVYARDHHVFLVFGFIEEENGVFYNSAVLINWNGNILGQYRKMHLVEEEKILVAKGNSNYPVFSTDIGQIGIMICWDSAFPETARILALKGADYLLIPSAWEKPKQRDWELVQSARAFDNVIFTACCNQVGAEAVLDFFGRSRITAPSGEPLTESVEDKEYILSARFDYTQKESLRFGYYALLRDRRPDTYQVLLEKGWEQNYE